MPPTAEARDQDLLDAIRPISAGEEAGTGDSCLSGGEEVWLADQDKSREWSLSCVDEGTAFEGNKIA